MLPYSKTIYICASAIIIVVYIFLIGCATPLAPSGGKIYWEHTSHPFAGPPFGPTSEEDSLDTANFDLTWENGNRFIDIGVGYKLADGGFYGPKLTGNVRAGVKFSFDNAWKPKRSFGSARCTTDTECERLSPIADIDAAIARRQVVRDALKRQHEGSGRGSQE